VAAENARSQLDSSAKEKLGRRVSELEAMQRIAQELGSTLDIGRLLAAVHREAMRALAAEYGNIMLRDPVSGEFRLGAVEGYSDEEIARIESGLSRLPSPHSLAGVAILAGHTQIVRDAAAEQPDYTVCVRAETRAAVSTPIFYEGNVVGVINLRSQQPNQFGAEAGEFLEMLAAQASIAIGNAWRYADQVREREALHRRNQQLDQLFQITHDARTNRPLEDILENAAYGIQESVGFNVVLFSVVEDDPPVMHRRVAAGLPLKVFEQLKAVRQPAAVLLDILTEDYRVGTNAYFFPHERLDDWGARLHMYTSLPVSDPESEDAWHANDMLLVPLWGSNHQIIGLLSVDDPVNRRRPDQDTIATLQIFASQAAVAIENRRLFEREQRRAEIAEAMFQVARAISSSLEPKRILQAVVDETARFLRVQQSQVILFDRDHQFGQMVAESQRGHSDSDTPFRVPLGEDPLMRRIIETKAPIIISDVKTDPLTSEMRGILEWRGVRSLLVMPMVVRDAVIGTLNLNITTQRRFTQEEIEHCQLIAGQAAAAIENARLYDEVWEFSRQLELRVEERTRQVRQERDRVEALYRITSELGASLDLFQVMNRALQLMQDVIGYSEGVIMLLDPRNDLLVTRAAIGRESGVPREGVSTKLPRGVGLAGWVLETGQPTIVMDTSKDIHWIQLAGVTTRPRSALAVPLATGDDVLGVLLLFHDQINFFEANHLTLVLPAANQVAIAIANAELYNFITDQAERLGSTLRQQQEETSRNKAILESIADGVLVNDLGNRVILMNAAAERILQARAATAMGQDVRNFFRAADPEGQRRLVSGAEELMKTRGASKIIHSRLEIGSKIISASLAPVLKGRGELLGLVTVLRDITREVEAERTKNEFVSTVSHELRTPMTSIKGYTDLLAAERIGPLNDEQRRFVSVVQRNADRLTNLINDLLDIGRIETGKIKLNVRPMQLLEVIRSVETSFEAPVQQKDQRLIVDAPAELPLINGDRDRLTQVLVNLVGNASLYTDEGGTITIRAVAGDETVSVSVSDTGIGISPEDQSKIFDRFYRGDTPRVRESQGTGLGLSIVKSFVEMHGGQITVESSLGYGSTFTLTLPACPPEAPAEPDAEQEA
jgi:PAS domain S-box-containing protein